MYPEHSKTFWYRLESTQQNKISAPPSKRCAIAMDSHLSIEGKKIVNLFLLIREGITHYRQFLVLLPGEGTTCTGYVYGLRLSLSASATYMYTGYMIDGILPFAIADALG